MMNLNKTILDLYVKQDKNQLARLKDTLEAEKKEYDVFFDEFLEVFSDKMSEHDKTSPVWEAYKKRYSQWQDITTNIKSVNYYMGML